MILKNSSIGPTEYGAVSSLILVIGAIGSIVCLVFAALGIKFKWFKRSINFDNLPTLDRSNESQNGSEPVLLRGVFHRNEDADNFIPIQRPTILPPVRVRRSSRGNLLLHSNYASSRSNEEKSRAVSMPPLATANVNPEPVTPTIPLPPPLPISQPPRIEDVNSNELNQIIIVASPDCDYKPCDDNYSDVVGINNGAEEGPSNSQSLQINRNSMPLESSHGIFERAGVSVPEKEKSKRIRFEKQKTDEKSTKNLHSTAIAERRATGFVRPPKDDIDEIVAAVNSSNWNSTTVNETEAKMVLKLDNYSDVENGYEKPRENGTTVPIPSPRNVRPQTEEQDAWSVIAKHRLLTQELNKQYKQVQQGGTHASRPAEFRNPLAMGQTKTMRDMKKNRPASENNMVLGMTHEDTDA